MRPALAMLLLAAAGCDYPWADFRLADEALVVWLPLDEVSEGAMVLDRLEAETLPAGGCADVPEFFNFCSPSEMLERTIEIPETLGERTVLSVRVYGVEALDEWPEMGFVIDGEMVRTQVVTAPAEAPVILQEEASLDAGEHDFALTFLNDVFEPENRDLRVDWIEIAALGDAGRTSERVSGQSSALIDGATSNGGPRGGALHFDGVDDQVVLGTPLALGEHYTVAFWIRSPNTPGHNTPIAIHGDPNVMVRVFNDSIEAIAYAASSPEWSSYDLMAERVLTAGEWHHVAFTVDETEVRIFVDAIEAAALVLTDAPQGNDTPDDELYLGQSGWDWMRDWFEGDLDDVRIYDRPLTSDEVARAMDE